MAPLKRIFQVSKLGLSSLSLCSLPFLSFSLSQQSRILSSSRVRFFSTGLPLSLLFSQMFSRPLSSPSSFSPSVLYSRIFPDPRLRVSLSIFLFSLFLWRIFQCPEVGYLPICLFLPCSLPLSPPYPRTFSNSMFESPSIFSSIPLPSPQTLPCPEEPLIPA